MALSAAAIASACRDKSDHAASPPVAAVPSERLRDLRFPPSPGLPDGERALVITPQGAEDLPIVIALHGRGESRSVDIGADGWPNNYRLIQLEKRVREPPLTVSDLRDMASAERLAAINSSLQKTPYGGLVIACPYAPDLSDRSADGAQSYGRFLMDSLLPRVRKEVGTRAPKRESTGIDGVSMGGRQALLIGLTHPEIFGVVGAIQPALKVEEAGMITDLAKKAMAKAPVRLRLLSSDDDPFLAAVRAAAASLKAASIPHDLVVIPGEHGYEFNRGPGGVELLMFQDRALRGMASI
jgi:hypothetical protein